MKTFVVDVDIATYNQEKYIAQAIESVLMQKTSFPIRILIGEDHSADNTRKIVKKFAESHPNIIVPFYRSKNIGVGAGIVTNGVLLLKESLQERSVKYIAMLDGDDYWTDPYKLQKQVDFLETHPECTICFHAFKSLIEEGNRESDPIFPPGQKPVYTLEDFLKGSFIAALSTVFRGGLFEDLPDWFHEMPQGDWPLYILAAQYGNIGYIDEVMGVHRVHGNGMWSAKGLNSMLEGMIKAYEIVNPYLEIKHQKINMRNCYKNSYELATLYEKQRDIYSARHFARKCFHLRSYKNNRSLDLVKLLFRVYIPSQLRKFVRAVFNSVSTGQL